MGALLVRERTLVESFGVHCLRSSDLPSDTACHERHDSQYTKKLDMEKVPTRDLQVRISVHL